MTRADGIAAYRHGDFAACRESLSDVVAADEHDLEAVAYLGAAHSRLEQHDAAVQMMLRIVRDLPDDARAYYNLGVALAGAGNDGAAVEAFTKALALRPAYARPGRALRALRAAQRAGD